MTSFVDAALEAGKFLASNGVVAALGYWFGQRGKSDEISLQRTKELNTVLANLLTIWQYFAKLHQLSHLTPEQKGRMCFPLDMLPVLIHNVKFFNENCFDELEASLQNLRPYDPLAYHELEGLGRQWKKNREEMVAPLLRATTNSATGEELQQAFQKSILALSTKSIEKHLLQVAKLISRRTTQRIRVTIAKKSVTAADELIDEYNREYYELMRAVLPHGQHLSYQDFQELATMPELQLQIRRVLPSIMRGGIGNFMTKAVQDPVSTSEEMLREVQASLVGADGAVTVSRHVYNEPRTG